MRLSLLLDMLLLSAAEAVDQSDELVTIKMHTFYGRCGLAEIWLLANKGDLLNAVLCHTGHSHTLLGGCRKAGVHVMQNH